jgi:hypothetical protein
MHLSQSSVSEVKLSKLVGKHVRVFCSRSVSV